MSEIIRITEQQTLRLQLMKLVSYDETAAPKAIAFVADSELNFNLFKDAYEKAHLEPTPNAKTDVAITEANQRLAIINS